MYSYRRHGHNEGDEPSFTQPLLYQAIEKRKPVREGYLEHLLALGGITREEADRIADERRNELQRGLDAARSEDYEHREPRPTGIWKGLRGGLESEAEDPDTGVARDVLARILEAAARVPEGFHPHPEARTLPRGAPRDGIGKEARRLVRGRGARLRVARPRGPPCPLDRPGHGPGDLQPAPCGAP